MGARSILTSLVNARIAALALLVFAMVAGLPAFAHHPGVASSSTDESSVRGLERIAERIEPGRYRVGDLPLTVPGTWRIVVRARIDDFTRHDLGADYTLH